MFYSLDAFPRAFRIFSFNINLLCGVVWLVFSLFFGTKVIVFKIFRDFLLESKVS